MVKIISRKPLGKQPVYDIGVAKDHNFLLANGLVASNCFNKSHSTAYAYVTYQTAYLKANYPVEYMAALLTASSGTQDKVEKYITTCQNMGIDVEPPNINRSQVDFTPVGEKILFGLSAVRNLGQGAIEIILRAREEAEGSFQSLADLCNRVDLRVVNRKALEALIYCGAFDCVENNRHQLIKDLEFIIPWAQSLAKDRESGQTNLFDLLGSSQDNGKKGNSWEAAPKATAVEDFSPADKLKQEKELLGFYVSDHPLKSSCRAAQILSPINLKELPEQKKRAKVSAVVLLGGIKKIMTKNNEPMAFLQMEDISGQAEGIVFPSTYKRIENIEDLLVEELPLIVWGKVEYREDQVQLIVEDIEPVETVRMVLVELTAQQATNQQSQHQLRSILQAQAAEKDQAKVPVVAIVTAGQQRQFVRLAQKFWVQNDRATVNALVQAKFPAYVQPLVQGNG